MAGDSRGETVEGERRKEKGDEVGERPRS